MEEMGFLTAAFFFFWERECEGGGGGGGGGKKKYKIKSLSQLRSISLHKICLVNKFEWKNRIRFRENLLPRQK